MDTQRAHIISGRWALGLGRKGVSAVATAFLLGLAAIVMIQPQRRLPMTRRPIRPAEWRG